MQRKILTKINRTYADNNIMKHDHNLKIICDEIIGNMPIESIILCGSRATGQGITDVSDYDMPIVMKTYLVPFYLSKLKKIEKRLSQKLCINVSINPLPTFRTKNAKGNLFLFKVKREGVTLYGKDYIRELDPGKIEDIPADKYFSFLFSAAKDLIQNFDLKFLKEDPSHEEGRKILYDAAKAMVYCAELHLLLKGYYETDCDDMMLKLSKIESEDILNDTYIAIMVKYRMHTCVTVDPIKFWYKAIDRVIETFCMLVQNHMNINIVDIEPTIDKYLTDKNSNHIKNLQYFSLVLLNRKKFFWRVLTTTTSVENKIRMSLLLLLLSIRVNNYIDKRIIEKSCQLLRTVTDVQYSDSDTILWNNIKDKIITNWSLGCTIIGV